VRRNLVAQAAGRAGRNRLHLAAKVVELALQHFDLLLLPENGTIERFEQILGKGQLDFQFLDFRFHPSLPIMTPPAHHWYEDAQALVSGTLLFALAVACFREAGLLTGGTTGIAFLAHYATGLPFGALYFIVNLPFYVFALKALGARFTLKTFCAVGLLSLFVELLPRWFAIGHIDPLFAAILGGLLAGAGLLMLIRHEASLGGIGVLAIYLQKTRGWRTGYVQMAADAIIVAGALAIVEPLRVGLSVVGALVLNLVLGINHRPGRYFGH